MSTCGFPENSRSYGLTANNNMRQLHVFPNIGASNYVLNGALAPGTTTRRLGITILAWDGINNGTSVSTSPC